MFHATKTRSVLTVALAAAALTLLFIPGAAFAARGHELSFEFGGPGSANGQLSSPGELAVDEATNTVYVLDRGNHRVESFDASTGAYVGQFDGSATPAGSFEALRGIAVDNDPSSPSHGDVYVIDGGHEVIDKFDPFGAYLNQITGTPEGGPFQSELHGIAVDSTGDLWVTEGQLMKSAYEFNNSVVNAFVRRVDLEERYEASKEAHFGVAGFLEPGLAIDSIGNIYVHQIFFGSANTVAKVTSTGRTINGGTSFAFGEAFGEDFEPPTGLAVEAGTDDPYIDNAGTWRRFTGAGKEIEHVAIPGGDGVGMAVDAATQTVYVADPSADLVYAYGPEAPAAPRIESASAFDVAATSAALQAQINPRSEPAEAPTSYRFEYLTEAEYQANLEAGRDLFAGAALAPSPEGELVPSYESETVSVRVQGISVHTAYRYRVFAANAHGGVAGAESSFTTQPNAAFSLLDSRGWELVSPPDKHGAELVPIAQEGPGGNVDQAAASGRAVTYAANAATDAEPEGSSNDSQVFSVLGPQGWISRDISPPHSSPTKLSNNFGQEYRFFSEDLARSVVQPFGAFEPSLSPLASEQTAFVHQDFGPSGPASLCTESCFTPLVTAENSEAGQPFGEEGFCPAGGIACGPTFVAASPDGRNVIVASNVPLLPGAPQGTLFARPDNTALYEVSEGTLRPVSKRPASEGGAYVPAAAQPTVGGLRENTSAGHRSARGAVSTDGSRVFFTELGGKHHLYLRYLSGEFEETLRLDVVQPGAEGTGSVAPEFQLATPDGSRAFFTDEQRLTPDSGAENEKPDLYECAIEETEESTLSCALTDLTPKTPSGESATVVGSVLGASASGGTIYFLADGVLAANRNASAEGATPGGCPAKLREAKPPPGLTCNLYVRSDGRTAFVADLAGEDVGDWELASGSGVSARVSPDGHWLAFMSQRPLTGYDNRDIVSGKRDEEVFLYHAGAAADEGALTCASCDPTNARPRGVEEGSVPHGSPVKYGGHWDPSTWLAASIPGYTPYQSAVTLYQSRYLSDGGRLFFNSPGALVPADSNGTWDVYEYEPPAAGGEEPPGDGCERSSSTYSPAASGCIDLVSSGTSPRESGFIDASEGGGDVFFLTGARLSSRDTDTATDLYDARIDGGEAQQAGPVRCLGDACQAPTGAPQDATPGSLTFDGPGNLTECQKGEQVKQGRCVKQKAKKHHKNKKTGHKKHKRTAGHKRGGGK